MIDSPNIQTQGGGEDLVRGVNWILTRHATYIAMGIGILALDLWTGPLLSFPILFVLPVGLSAWLCSSRLAYALAGLLPVGRFFIAVLVDMPDQIYVGMANALIRIAVLSILVSLITRIKRQSREIETLEGLLPICMGCKRICDKNHRWQSVEKYVAEHTETGITHGYCPDCMQDHYGDLSSQSAKQDPPL